MIRSVLCVLALVATLHLSGPHPASAAPPVDPVVAGNAAAAAGDHATAAAAFERAIAARGWSAGSLRGLGDAYEAAGQPGRAILAYERASLLAPRDAAIAAKLSQLRESAGVSVPVRSRLERALGMLTADEWSLLALGAGTLAGLGIVGLAWSVRRRSARSVALTGLVATAFAAAAALHTAPPPERAVIVAAAGGGIAPFADPEAAFVGSEGAMVAIEQQRGDYVYVRDGERSGWLPRTAVERIAPADA